MTQTSIRRYLKHGTLPQLRVFEASVRLGSLARAAEELHMAPPTASVQIKKLSETIGSPLLEQVGKRMYPTDVGRRVFDGCNEVFRAFGSLEASLQDLRTLGAGELRLAAISSARYFAPRLLGAFAQRHPAISTALHVGNSSELAQRLRRNEDDLYLVADMAASGEVVIQSLLANPLVAVARADHPLAGRRHIPFAEFAREPFLLREMGSGTRSAALGMFATHGLAPIVRMELGSNEAVREAILAGLGVSVLARYTLGLEAEPAGLVCLDVNDFPVESHWQLAYPLGKHVSASARAFLEFARTQGKELARGSAALPCAV
jgi:LysR family transcriptional regulator, low CO2-responsive transcriptional regulator